MRALTGSFATTLFLPLLGLLTAASSLSGCGGNKSVLTLDVRSKLCIDKEGDGSCTQSWMVVGSSGGLFYTDYLNQRRYAGLVVLTLADGSRLAWPGPGVTITRTVDHGSSVDYQLAVSSNPQKLGVQSQKAHFQTDGTWAIGGFTSVYQAWMVIDHAYDPAKLDPKTITGAEVHYAVDYQVDVPMNTAHNDSQPYVYAGSASFTASEMGVKVNTSLPLNTDPLMLTKVTDKSGAPVTDFSTVTFTVAK